MRKGMFRSLGALAAVAVAVIAAEPARAGSAYSTDFESPTFSTGSVNGQDGWMVTNPGFDQEVVDDVAHSGRQSWRHGNSFATGSFGDQPFSAPLPGGVKAGESGAVGASETIFGYSVWFRAADTTAADGSFISLSATDASGSRINYVGLGNTAAGGLSVTVYDTTSNGFGNAVTWNPYILENGTLDRTLWHELMVRTSFFDGAANDVTEIYLDGALAATIGTWEDYYRNDPEQAGNGNLLFGVDRVIFRAGGTGVNGAEGFYFDDFSSFATSVPLPPAALPGLAGLGLMLGASLLRRSRRNRG